MKKIMVIAIFISLITLSRALAQWSSYTESFYTPATSLFNSLNTNFYPSSLFSSSAFRGLENYNNYTTSGATNFYQPTFSSFPGSFAGGVYGGFGGLTGGLGGLYGGLGGLYGGLYSGLTNYNLFSPGIFPPSSFIPNTYNTFMQPLSLGQWNTPSSWPGSMITANNYWPQVSNLWSRPYPGGQYPYPYPSPSSRTSSGLTIIRTNTEGLIEERIRDTLGLGANEPITTAKALTLTSLDASDMCFEESMLISPPGVFVDGGPTHEIRCEPDIDLNILEELTNLAELNLSRNTIDDLSPLAELTNLEKLDLHTTNTKDIAALASLTKLTELNLQKTKVNDLSPLAGLTNLELLELHDNQIEDLSPLAGLTNLEILELRNSKIEDISPLANLTNLKELILDDNRIIDLSPLAGLVNLKKLLLCNNEIRDLSPLLSLTNLEKVELRGNELNNGDCPVIEELRSRGVSVTLSISDDLDCD